MAPVPAIPVTTLDQLQVCLGCGFAHGAGDDGLHQDFHQWMDNRSTHTGPVARESGLYTRIPVRDHNIGNSIIGWVETPIDPATVTFLKEADRA